MKNLVLLSALFISIVEINAQVSWIKKDTSTYEGYLGDKVSYDSTNDVLLMHQVITIRRIIEIIDTLGMNSFKIVYSGDSKEFLLKEPDCLWDLGQYKENEKTKARVKTEKSYHSLKTIESGKILFATKKGHVVLLETEEYTESSLNTGAITLSIILFLAIALQSYYFVKKYIRFFRDGIRYRWKDDSDFAVVFCHMALLLICLPSYDPLPSRIALGSFIIGGLLRIGLMFKPMKKEKEN